MLVTVRHEVLYLCLAAVRLSQDRSEQRKPSLQPHADIERAALADVGAPRQVLVVTDSLLGFCDGSSADASGDEIAPEFFGGGEFFSCPPVPLIL